MFLQAGAENRVRFSFSKRIEFGGRLMSDQPAFFRSYRPTFAFSVPAWPGRTFAGLVSAPSYGHALIAPTGLSRQFLQPWDPAAAKLGSAH